MARHRRFTDKAGFTRHCWECVHARNWRVGFGDKTIADCEIIWGIVGKYESPDNVCCRLECGSYDDGRGDA